MSHDVCDMLGGGYYAGVDVTGRGPVADAGILARLAALGITGQRALDLANAMDPGQVAAASDAQLMVMISGRESGDATDQGHLYPDGHLYPG